jgi:2-polyprenyl-3-methyl-5-hydroxy-6-metoxy-1,4-benzoquinol methylase
MTRPTITYGRSVDGWQEYPEMLQRLIRVHGFTKILDIGGGANPLLPSDYMAAQGLDYTIWDISETEMQKARGNYRMVVQDITAPQQSPSGQFDFIFTKMLAEHVRSGMRLHHNVFTLLSKGGMAAHFFPTLYALPFVVNKIVPEKLASRLLDLLSPRDRHQHAKFPAYYSWCRGPTQGALQRLVRLGYEIVEYKGFFGHPNYYRRVPFALRWHTSLAEFLLRHPVPYLTSFAYVILRKP